MSIARSVGEDEFSSEILSLTAEVTLACMKTVTADVLDIFFYFVITIQYIRAARRMEGLV